MLSGVLNSVICLCVCICSPGYQESRRFSKLLTMLLLIRPVECSYDQENHGFGFLLADFVPVYLDESIFHDFAPVCEFLFDNSGDLRVVTGQNIDLRKCTRALVTEIVLCYIGHECIEIVDVRLVALAAVCLKPADTDLRNEIADVHDVAQYEIVLAVEIIEKVGV